MNDFELVTIAGLLHDVGKLIHRGRSVKGNHMRASAGFTDQLPDAVKGLIGDSLDDLSSLVMCHHDAWYFPPDYRVSNITDDRVRTLATIVSTADNYSSYERDESRRNPSGPATPLDLVFAQVGVEENDILRKWSYPLGTLKPDVMPIEYQKLDTNAIDRHVEAFRKDIEKFNPTTFRQMYTGLLTLLYKYTAFLPSATMDYLSSISLFDHLRTTSAIAACIYRYHEENNEWDQDSIKHHKKDRFRLYAGYVMGIQNYIFDIAENTGKGGVAKRLRARSLYVQLLSDAAAYRTVHELDLPISNIVLAAGAKFYILVPNTESVTARLDELTRKMNADLLDRFNGELWLNTASRSFDQSYFDTETPGKSKGFSTVLSWVNADLALGKLNPMKSMLCKEDSWNADAFLRPTSFEGKPACPVCGRKFPVINRDVDQCKWCALDERTGQRLPRTHALAFYPDKSGDIDVLDWSVSLVENGCPVKGDPYVVSEISTEHLDISAPYPVNLKPIANYIPTDEDGRVKTFEKIAERRKGYELLGYLKADVDNLGLLVSEGFKRDNHGNLDSISRIATFSRQLEMFFSGWIKHSLETKYSDCYTVYCGGDDLFIIGPWDRIIDLSTEISSRFADYTHNPEMTLSAGISLVKPSYPLAAASRAVIEALGKAKKRPEKDSVSILSDTMGWDDLAVVTEDYTQLAGRVGVTSAFLYHLLWCGRNYRRYKEFDDVDGLKYHPLLAYNIARNLSGRDQQSVKTWAVRFLDMPMEGRVEREAAHLDVIAGLAIFASRGGG